MKLVLEMDDELALLLMQPVGDVPFVEVAAGCNRWLGHVTSATLDFDNGTGVVTAAVAPGGGVT